MPSRRWALLLLAGATGAASGVACGGAGRAGTGGGAVVVDAGAGASTGTSSTAAGGAGGVGGSVTGDASSDDVLVQGEGYISRFLVGGATLFWVRHDGGGQSQELRSRPIAGGATTTIASAHVTALAFSGGFLYWSDAAGGVQRRGEAGGPIETLASGQSGLFDLAVDDQFVYFTRYEELAGGSAQSIQRVPLAGGAPVTLVNDDAGLLAVDATHLYWLGWQGMFRLSKPSGSPEPWVSEQLGPSPAHDLSAGSTHVFFATGNDPGSIGAIAKSDGAVTTFASVVLFGDFLCSDGEHLYFGHEGTWGDPPIPERGVARFALGGGPMEVVASEPLDYVRGVGLDSKFVYWALSEGTIQRKLK